MTLDEARAAVDATEVALEAKREALRRAADEFDAAELAHIIALNRLCHATTAALCPEITLIALGDQP